MKVFIILTLLAVSIHGAEVRDKRHVVLVPQPPLQQVILVPAAPQLAAIHNPMPVRVNMACGTPAYTCQGSCASNGVGGIPAVRGEFPWLVQLFTNGRFICGGSIIDNYFILTSASCIEPSTPTSVAALRVRLGDFKQNSNEDGQYVERNVTTIYRHTDFIPQGKNPAVHDLALLKLTEPIAYTDYIRPICLDDGSPRVDTGYMEGILAGYGKISYSNRPVSGVLHKVGARIATPTECQGAYPGVILRDTNICAGTPTLPSVDPCVGDNGGPLIVKTGANSYEQVGVASYGISCAGPPPIFTRVSSYRAWIDQVKMQKL